MCVGIHFSQVHADGGHKGCRNTTSYNTSTHYLCILMSAVHSRYPWCTSTVWSTPLSTTGKHIHRVEHTSLNHWYAHPPCGAHLSHPLVCMHIHRVEHTSLNHWYAHPPCGAHLSQPLVCTSTVWSTPLSTTGMHIHRVEHTSLNHWYAHPQCGAHLSQPLVCTSTVWSTPH